MVGRCCKVGINHFHYACRFTTSTLAHEVDSLVRVSRRVGKNHLSKIAKAPSDGPPPGTNRLTGEPALTTTAHQGRTPHLASQPGLQQPPERKPAPQAEE